MSIQKSTLFTIVPCNLALLTLQLNHVPTWFTSCCVVTKHGKRAIRLRVPVPVPKKKNDKHDDTHYCSHPSKSPALHFLVYQQLLQMELTGYFLESFELRNLGPLMCVHV